jgi:hypothetical protein
MTDIPMLKKQIGMQATRLGECIRKINQLTSELHHAREEVKRLIEALTLITEMDGDQPARSDWDMVRIARAAADKIRAGVKEGEANG